MLLILIGGAVLTAVILWSYWYERSVTTAQPPAGGFVETSYGRVHAIHERPQEPTGARPIVVIHGSTTNCLDMEIDMKGRLEGTREVFIPDRPGHGFSDRPLDGWRLCAQVAMLREAVVASGIERPIVMGQSFGGAIALRYALDFPDEVAGLVLVAPVTHAWPGGVAWYNRVALNPLYGWVFRRSFIALYGRFGSPKGVARALRGSLLRNRYHARTRVPLTFRPRAFRHNAEDIVRLYEQLTGMEKRYGEITCPVESVAGSHDMTVMTSVHSRSLASQVKGLSLTVIEGGGHALHHTHPDQVMEAVERLDARLAQNARSPLQGALRRLTSVFPRSS